MANYLVASGSRKISQLEIATNPVPAGSSSVMPLVIGDAIPITNGTTVQITPDNFLSNLVFDANEDYTGNNTFTGLNTFTNNNTFIANNSFLGNNTFSGSITTQFISSFDSVVYNTFVQGGRLEMYDDSVGDTLRIRVDSGNGILLEDYGADYGPFMKIGTGQGRVDILRETHFSQNVVITGSLTALEIFTTYETASVLYSSGSTKFGDTMDDEHQITGSVLLSGSFSIVDGGLLDGVDLSVFSSSVQAESQSFAQRDTDLEFFSSSQYNDDSSSFAVRSTDLEFFSSSQYNDDSSSFESRLSGLTTDSASFSTRVTDLEFFSSSQYNDDSSSVETRLTQNTGDISILSASFEATSSKLIDSSGSFSTRTTDLEFFSSSQYNAESSSVSVRLTVQENFSSSQYNAESSSFASRITQNVGDISLLSGSFLTASGSFSTRVTQNEADILQNEGDISLLSGSFLTASGSFSTRVTNNELTGSDHEDRIVKGTNSVTSSAVSSSYIDLDVLANGDIPAHKAGRIFFGQEDGALNVYNEEADITLQVGQEFLVRAYNKSGVEITDGTPVFASSSQGDRIGIYPATAPDHTSGPVFDNHILGVATHTIGIAEEGYVTAQGIVRGVDTQNFNAGDILYLQTGSPATVTDFYRNDPPPFPYDIVQVGYVARSAANGFIFVEPKEPVHFSNISGLSGSYTPEVGDLWVYQENGSWTHTRNLTGSYYIGGDLLPETTEVHDLGSTSLRWRDLYLSGSTIDLGGLLIQKDDDGNVRFIDGDSGFRKTIAIDSITGSLDISGSLKVTGSVNQEGDGIRINRTTSGEPYIFFDKNGVNRGAIYGNSNTDGLRFFAASGSLPLTVATASVSMDGNVTVSNGNLTVGSSTVTSTSVSSTNVSATNLTGKLGSWYNAGYLGKTVSASGTAVLTIDGGSNINISDIDMRVYLDGNSALNAHLHYYHVSRDTGDSSYTPSITEYYNESVGSFQVSTTDFAVSFSGDDIIITYTNQASGTNGIIFYVKGLYNSISIA